MKAGESSKNGTGGNGASKVQEKDSIGPGIPGFKDAESKDSMASRMDRFLDDHFIHIIKETRMEREREVAVVSHGMILATLWRCLLRRFALHSVTVGQGVDLRGESVTSLEHLGSWSNTGYLELNIQPQLLAQRAAEITEILTSEAGLASDTRKPNAKPMTVLYDWKMTIRAVNCRDHLRGLKRTGGGVGSSKHDESQKNIDAFFKKRRID